MIPIILYIFSVIILLISFLFCINSFINIIFLTNGLQSLFFLFITIFIGMLTVIIFIYCKQYIDNSLKNKIKFKRIFLFYLTILIFPFISQMLEIYYLYH